MKDNVINAVFDFTHRINDDGTSNRLKQLRGQRR